MQGWLWVVSIGLGLCVVVSVCVLLVTHNRAPLNTTALVTSEPSVVVPYPSPTIEPAVTAVDSLPQLPRLDFLPGSVEEACGLNDFPPHWASDENRESRDHPKVLVTKACWTALEEHIYALNPYSFLWGEELYQERLASFIVLENPITFERIFVDPTGDLARVQDSLSRPECLLTGDESNWELKEECHADAFLNYALVNRFCFHEGNSVQTKYYWWTDNPTPEQDRYNWMQDLKEDWLKMKCEELAPSLEFTEHYPQLYELVMSFRDPKKYARLQEEGSAAELLSTSIIASRSADTNYVLGRRLVQELLIEQAARLGDDAAGLTQPSDPFMNRYREEGYKYGRFSWIFTRPESRILIGKRRPPTTDRLLQTFNMLALLDGPRPDPIHDIEFDWERVARHLCEPPYFERTWSSRPQPVENADHSSCKEIVHEIRQRDIKFRPVLNTLDKFEQVAIELGVYE